MLRHVVFVVLLDMMPACRWFLDWSGPTQSKLFGVLRPRQFCFGRTLRLLVFRRHVQFHVITNLNKTNYTLLEDSAHF